MIVFALRDSPEVLEGFDSIITTVMYTHDDISMMLAVDGVVDNTLNICSKVAVFDDGYAPVDMSKRFMGDHKEISIYSKTDIVPGIHILKRMTYGSDNILKSTSLAVWGNQNNTDEILSVILGFGLTVDRLATENMRRGITVNE